MNCKNCGKPIFKPKRCYCCEDCGFKFLYSRDEENRKYRKNFGIKGVSKAEIERLKLKAKQKNDFIEMYGVNNYG